MSQANLSAVWRAFPILRPISLISVSDRVPITVRAHLPSGQHVFHFFKHTKLTLFTGQTNRSVWLSNFQLDFVILARLLDH